MITTFMEMDHIGGQMVESTLVLGKTIKCTGKECLSGLMDVNMKERMLMIKKKVMVFLNGLTVGNILAAG